MLFETVRLIMVLPMTAPRSTFAPVVTTLSASLRAKCANTGSPHTPRASRSMVQAARVLLMRWRCDGSATPHARLPGVHGDDDEGEDDDEDDAGNSVASVVAAAVAVAAVWGEIDWLAGPGTSAAADVWAVLETACGDGGRARGLEEDTCRTATLARAPQSADTSCDWASACAT